ncbi:NUAK family SNF1-like kinase 1 [Esox lucius]|uniref:non-specific serine/threonine protein kinase n=1 Tax=Esox lucius TaxID=8010 RepID=A0A3P8X965_ESOLU|nr:NUAK family SNF1-like kinase 1 [Esox lucius]
MGKREARGNHHGISVMNTEDRFELENLQNSAATETGNDDSGSSNLNSHPLLIRDKRTGSTKDSVSMDGPHQQAGPVEVKKHQHKHNLKHRYEVMETLGKGTYGKVKRAMERTTKKTVAIKSIRKEHIIDDLDRVHIQREIEITSALKHPNIIRFHEVFESRDKIVIVMEYASRGELYDYVHERRRLSETEARDIFRQITSAVHYCHKNGVVHRDLKLENILLDQDLNVKLADFGLSNHFKRDHLLETYCGSPLYASPEIVKGQPYCGPEVDCWAMGVLLYALVYGSMPFDGASYRALTEQISQGRYRRPNPPSDACALIDWLLTVRPEERATVEDVAGHWWVNWGYEGSVCDCPSPPLQDCPSPMLARYIDWQSRVAASSHPSSHPFYFSFPLKWDRVGGLRSRGERSSLRKSRKENAIHQSAIGTCSPTPSASHSTFPSLSSLDRKKPKGILKPQRSFDLPLFTSSRVMVDPSSTSQSCNVPPLLQTANTHTHTDSHSDGQAASLPVPCTYSHFSSKTPKKGILKNLNWGESGYCSSPEILGSGEGASSGDRAVDGGMSCSPEAQLRPHILENSPTLQTEAVRRRKGILKRNGKFSRSLDLPDTLHTSSSALPRSPDTLQYLLQASGDSRPPNALSDDSLFSSDSFDLLDLSAQSRRRIFSRATQVSACSSEELDDSSPGVGDRIGSGRGWGRGREEEDET